VLVPRTDLIVVVRNHADHTFVSGFAFSRTVVIRSRTTHFGVIFNRSSRTTRRQRCHRTRHETVRVRPAASENNTSGASHVYVCIVESAGTT